MNGLLPRGWTLAVVRDVVESIQYGYTESANLCPVGPKFLRITDIQDGQVDWGNVPYCECSDDEKKRYLLSPGDIVFARTGATTGKSFLITICPTAVFASYLIRMRLGAVVDPRFFALFLQSPSYWSQIMTSRKGSAQPGVNAQILGTLRVSFAPLPEQHRIVAEIEKQFSRLDACVAGLKRVQTALKRYRASILKAACEGRLVPTEAELARQEGRPYETGEQLLERVLVERRARWEADQLAKMQAQGKTPKDDSWKGKYQEPVGPDVGELPELPGWWVWTSLPYLFWDSGYGTSVKCDYFAPGPPVVRIPNIVAGRLDMNDTKCMTQTQDLRRGDELAPGDFILIRTNGSRSLIGRGCLIRQNTEKPCYFASYLIRFRLLMIDGLPEYIAAIWDSPSFRSVLEGMAATSAGQYNVSLSSLSSLPVPLPPITEQHRIVAEVERRLSIVEELEAVVKTNLKRADRLRQSILKRAFEGKLVPQDSEDEPASVLLERIQQSKSREKAGA